MIVKEFSTFLRLCTFSLFAIVCACSDNSHERADQHYHSGKDFFEKGDIESAQIEFNNALSIEPNRVDVLYGLALTLEQEKDWRNVLRYLNKILELDPEHEPSLVKIVRLYMASNQLDRAHSYLQVLMGQASDNVTVLVLLANYLFSIDDNVAALSTLERAMELEPNNSDALWLKARIDMVSGNYASAIQVLERGVETHSENVYFYAALVRAYNELSQYDKGIAVFQSLLQIEPENPAFHQILAKQYLIAGKRQLAQETLEKFVEKYPSDVSFRSILDFHLKHLSLEQTKLFLSRSIQRYPNQLLLHQSLASILANEGNYAESRTTLHKAKVLPLSDREQLSLDNQLAILSLREGKREDAVALVDKILEKDPQNIKAITTRAGFELEKGEIESAIRLLRSALHKNSRDASVLVVLAKAHDLQGAKDLARDYYQRAAQLSQHKPGIVLDYGRFLFRHNMLGAADQLLSTFQPDVFSLSDTLELHTRVKLALGQWREAEMLTKKLERVAEGQSLTHVLQAWVYAGDENFSQSTLAFERAYRATDQRKSVLDKFLQAMLSAKELERFQTHVQDMLSKTPEDDELRFFLARSFELDGKLAAAKEHYERILDSGATADLYGALYRVSSLQDDLAAGIRWLEKGVEKYPNNLDLLMKLSSELKQVGDLQKSKLAYEKWLKAHPDTKIVINNLAYILLEENSAKSHKKAYELVQPLRDVKVAIYQDTVGWAYYRQGEFEKALAHLKSAGSDLVDVPEHHFHLGAVYLALGKVDEARYHLRIAKNNYKGQPDWRPELETTMEKI